MSVKSMQKVISDWADEVFPNRTIHNAISKLVLEEIPEYLMAQEDPLELADIAILVYDIAHLAGVDLEKAVMEKMEINKLRKWELNEGTGIMRHVEPLTCYQCDKATKWLAPDSRCGKCTRFTPDEIRGEV